MSKPTRADAARNDQTPLAAHAQDNGGLADFDAVLRAFEPPLDIATLPVVTRRLVAWCPSLPLPGAGRTLARWRFLAALAAQDLSLVKIYEAHTDALAILAELGARDTLRSGSMDDGEGEIWAVWAARAPQNDLHFGRREGDDVYLSGTKAWCSGASFVTHALVTCLDAEGRDWLAALPMNQPGVNVSTRGWEAVGMQATQSVQVDLREAKATLIGPQGAYLHRAGFWHGGVGIAACWFGAAAALGKRLRDAGERRDNPHLHAHLGAADTALTAARAVLREAAHTLDAAPRADAMALALRARSVVENTVEVVLRACGRGLGAGPFCQDRWFARMTADLPVFVRQSHAEQDLAALGRALAGTGEDWQL